MKLRLLSILAALSVTIGHGALAQNVRIEDVSTTGFRNTAVTSTPVQVKAGGGFIYGYNIVNPNASPIYLKLYDALAANVTVGTTTPTNVIAVPASGAFFLPKNGYSHGAFSTGLSIAVVTGLADNNTTAPATAVYVQIGYK